MSQEYERAKAVAAKLEAEHNMITSEIVTLIQQNQRFSPEAARLANERSMVELAWNRVLGRIRRMEAERNG